MARLASPMNSDQLSAFHMVNCGHNVYIGGQAGTGKSFLTQHIVLKQRSLERTTALTCSTGVACSVYPQHLNPMTLHKWTGLSDGRFTNSQLLNLLHHDDKYAQARDRIINTKVLIIDEISMISCKVFEQLELICREINNNNTPFGGIQVVVVGDFLQLPPVRNNRYCDPGEFCLKASVFPIHHTYLTTIIRQQDKLFCEVIRKVSIGQMDKLCQEFIRKLNRPLSKSANTTRLFSQNIMADMFNRDVIMSMVGQLYSFESIDEGEERHLNTLVVQKMLWLKEGARVMLLRNLTDDLVNGLQGKIVTVKEGEVDVYFERLDRVVTLSRVTFTLFDPCLGRNLAVRSQIPLKLSYAITIHKAQGMTLERVEVDCRQIFQPGQLGVAMGRVKSADSLRVINFSPEVIIPQHESIKEFMQEDFRPILPDRSCCQSFSDVSGGLSVQEDVSSSVSAPTDCDVDSLMSTGEIYDDEEFDAEIREVDLSSFINEVPSTIPLPDDFDFISKIKGFAFESPTNENQVRHNRLVQLLTEDENTVKQFLTSLYSAIGRIYFQNFGTEASVIHKANVQTAFFADI